jgi:hypothetical protein
MVKVNAEERTTGQCYYGEFGEGYIEDITRKAQNFKRFRVFVNMLMSGLEGTSSSVIVDILT